MSNKINDSGILEIIAVIYLVISQIMTIYFWWLWAKNHSFLNSIIIGPFVAEFKGLLWFFFI